MFNTYTNSVPWPIRSKCYLDYCSLLPERSETHRFVKAPTTSFRYSCTSSRSRCYCSCCYSTPCSSFVKPKVSISPGFVLYGLRQSTLIQFPSIRRRLLVGGRFLGCEANEHCCESEIYSSCGGTRRNRGFKLRASEECGRSCPDDVEAMISFLSEEVIDEERNWKLVSRIEDRKKVRYGGEGNVRKVKVEVADSSGNGGFIRKSKREGVKRSEGVSREKYKRNGVAEDVKLEEEYDCVHCGGRKKNSQVENESRRGSKLVIESKNYKGKEEEREVRPRRTKSSSCSSYYSLASSGDFESDTEDQDEDVEYRRENLRRSENKVVKQSTKGNKSCKETSQVHSRRKREETANGVSSSYHFEEGETSNQAVIRNQRRGKRFSQTGNRVSESTGNYEEDMEIHEIHVNDAETNSQNQKIFGEREDNRVTSIGNYSGGDNIESSQQQLKKRLDARYSSEERVSEIQRRTKYSSSQEEGINVMQNFPEAKYQQPPVEERISTQAGLRMSNERFSQSSEIHDMDIRNTHVSQSESQIRNQEAHTSLVSNYHIDQNRLQNLPEAKNNQQPPVEERISTRPDMRMSNERFSQRSEIHDIDIRNTYVSQSESKTRNQEVHAGLVSGLESENRRNDYHIDQYPLQNFPEANNDQQPPEKISKQGDMRMSTEQFSKRSDIHNIDIRNTYVSQSQSQIRNQEVHAGLVSGLQSEGRRNDYHIDQNPLQKMQSDKTSVSVSHTSDATRYTEIQRKSEKRLIGQGNTEIVQLDGKVGTSGAWKDPRLDHVISTKEGQRPLGLQISHEKLSVEASSSQSSSTLGSGNRMQLVDLVSGEMQGSETTLIPPSSQLVSRGSRNSYGAGGVSIQEISHGTSESGYPTDFEHPRAGAIVNSQSAGELMRFTAHEDALDSAHRLEQSSEKFIGEFVKKAKHEVTNTETERRAESNQLKRRDSRRSSGGSGAKGPSEEMWITDSAQVTPLPGATEGNATEGNAISKRSGRSLWSVIADIARLRWGPRAGSPDSNAKLAGKSSSNESVSSATFFSGREHDGSSDDNTKGDRVLPQETASPHQLEIGQTSSTSQIVPFDATKLKQQSGRHEGVLSSQSSTILEGGSASYHKSSTSSVQNAGVDEGRDFEFRRSETASTEVPMRLPSRNLLRSPAIKEPSESSPTEVPSDINVTMGEGRYHQAHVPGMDAIQRPLPFPGRNLRSPVINEHSEFRPGMVSSSSSVREQVEQQQQQQLLTTKSQVEETGSVPTDSALIQRKLQRNKQVIRDSFEEWEEAYKVEAERRTVDEIFMREALEEAKKAADIWEVPVGAVLVHDGKIIARGFNLVEDLRDSTAHAEMICIREGSKVLRSWRLADTTLYVTLEPCPMCAGAILQARVNTLVWGAPNKLLGADGSWIRLFPGGEGNGSARPPPPVHPFHPKMIIRRGVLESECAQTMQQFFQLRRKKKDKNLDPSTSTDHHHHHHHPSKLLNKMHQILPFFCL